MIEIYDTTLRDGTQRVGLCLSCDDKIRIAQKLDALGIAIIEGGWPGSNPKDTEFFRRARDLSLQNAKLAAFGATKRIGIAPEDDPNLRALLSAQTPIATIFGKSWLLHVKDVLRATADENLRLIEDSVAYLVANGKRVIYDAEHFFDGYLDDPAYALETLRAAKRGGAHTLVLCETNGGRLPWEVAAVVKAVVADVGGPVGVHCHNDGESAVANSLEAVRAGAVHVQGTINGYGERCGNANLCAIIPNLEFKMKTACLPKGKIAGLSEVARFVADIANLNPDEHMAYVGRNAFTHKGGVHVAALRRNAKSYNHIEPELVGNRSRVVVSELSGRGNVRAKAEEFGLGADDKDIGLVLNQIKDREAEGFSYEAAEASVALLVERQAPNYQVPYRLIDYMVTVEHREHRGTFAEATIKVEVDGQVFHTASDGDGPVSALDRALRKVLLPVFPALADIKLIDYKVRILDGDQATSATTRVVVRSSDGHETWDTVGASENIIEASFCALNDALEYGLSLRKSQKPMAKVAGK
jgi:2-isopropylmalate synthase